MIADYKIERTDKLCEVNIQGALTAVLIPELKEALRRELELETTSITFDLKHTTMLDSSGIGLLIASGNSMVLKGGSVSVIHTPPEVFELMKNMRLISRLNITPDADSK